MDDDWDATKNARDPRFVRGGEGDDEGDDEDDDAEDDGDGQLEDG